MRGIILKKKFKSDIAKSYRVLTRKSRTCLKLPAQHYTLALFRPNNKCIAKITQYMNNSSSLLENCALSHSESIYIRQRHKLSQITQCHQHSFLNCHQRCITSLALNRVVRLDCVDKDSICAFHHPVQARDIWTRNPLNNLLNKSMNVKKNNIDSMINKKCSSNKAALCFLT